MDRLLPGAPVTHPGTRKSPNMSAPASVKALVGEPDRSLAAADHDRLADATIPAPIEVACSSRRASSSARALARLSSDSPAWAARLLRKRSRVPERLRSRSAGEGCLSIVSVLRAPPNDDGTKPSQAERSASSSV